MPPDLLARDARELYASLVQQHGFADPDMVKRRLVNALNRRYQVSASAMRYRLLHWPLEVADALAQALRERLPFLP